MDQIGILQHLGEKEAVLHIIEASSTSNVNVTDFTVPRAYTSGTIDGNIGVPCPVPIFFVFGCTVRIIKALHNFWTQDIIGICDVEARLLVESYLIGGDTFGAIDTTKENFWADASCILAIGIFASVYEFE